MTKDEALKLALEALEIEEAQTAYPGRWLTNAITALREALAEQPAQQKPVGSLSVRYHRGCKSMTNTDFDYNGDLPEGDYELYTSPPAQRQPLTKDKITELFYSSHERDFNWPVKFARAIETAHGIKENT